MIVKEERLEEAKSTRVFTHNLRQYVAQSCQNKIRIMAANDLQTIDVLSSPHITSRIDCFDVADVSKDVVCYSSLSVEGKGVVSRSLVVFGLQDTSYLIGADQKVTENLDSLL